MLIKLKVITIIIMFLLSFSIEAKSKFNIRIVCTTNYLTQYQENGVNKGSSIAILNVLLKANNIKATVEFMPWARAYNIAKNRSNTIIMSMVRTPEREKHFYWIGKVSELSRVYISLKNHPENFVVNDLQAKQKTVVIERNSSSHKRLLKRGFVEGKNLYVVSSMKQKFNLFIKGRVDLIYDDPAAILNYIQANHYDTKKAAYQISYQPIKAENRYSSYIAININSDLTLVNQLKKTMEKFSKTPQYKKLLYSK